MRSRSNPSWRKGRISQKDTQTDFGYSSTSKPSWSLSSTPDLQFPSQIVIMESISLPHGMCGNTERCPSGQWSRSWKPMRVTPPWVRIPLSPPYRNKKMKWYLNKICSSPLVGVTIWSENEWPPRQAMLRADAGSSDAMRCPGHQLHQKPGNQLHKDGTIQVRFNVYTEYSHQ